MEIENSSSCQLFVNKRADVGLGGICVIIKGQQEVSLCDGTSVS